MVIDVHSLIFWIEAFDTQEENVTFHRNVSSVFILRHDLVLRRQQSEHSNSMNANLV
jgi:hypothetical protein